MSASTDISLELIPVNLCGKKDMVEPDDYDKFQVNTHHFNFGKEFLAKIFRFGFSTAVSFWDGTNWTTVTNYNTPSTKEHKTQQMVTIKELPALFGLALHVNKGFTFLLLPCP